MFGDPYIEMLSCTIVVCKSFTDSWETYTCDMKIKIILQKKYFKSNNKNVIEIIKFHPNKYLIDFLFIIILC